MPRPGDALSHSPTELGVVATSCFFVQLGGWMEGRSRPASGTGGSEPSEAIAVSSTEPAGAVLSGFADGIGFPGRESWSDILESGNLGWEPS